MIHVLKVLRFFDSTMCYMSVAGLLMLYTMSATSQATPETQPLLADQRRDTYTDRLTFIQSRVNKLQEIIWRAQSAQRRIRRNPLYRTTRDQQRALKPWKRVESHARRMLVELQDRTRTLETSLVRQRSRVRRYVPQASRPVAQNVLLTRLDGKKERMATHRGEVVLVHFWATWCRPCLKEMPALQRLYHQFRNREFTVLAVSLDVRKKELKKFFRRRPLHFPVYFDPGRIVYQKMIGGMEILPRSLLIDRDGRIVQSYTGAEHLTAPAMVTDIRNLLDTN